MGFSVFDSRFSHEKRRSRRGRPARGSVAQTRAGCPRHAFTLVELIISIALVLIVMLGVNFVFRMTGDTIGSGQVLNEQVRNNRGAQAVMFDDFGKMMRDGPALVLRSRAVPAFRNQSDQNADGDGNPLTLDQNGDGDDLDLEDRVYGSNYNTRNHRVDTISFFAQGLFRRQTGGGETYPGGAPGDEMVSSLTSNEAWIWYGHLRLPDNDLNYGPNPFSDSPTPQAQNPNNFFSSQWILGRVAMLLRQPDGNGRIISGTAPSQVSNAYILGNGTFSPLSFNSSSQFLNPQVAIQDNRLDLAGTSASAYRSKLSAAISSQPGVIWWEELMSGTPNGNRFRANPFVARPISAASYSQQAPIFLTGATQFIVEYAGDFLNQTVTGNVTNVVDTFVRWDSTTSAYVQGSTDGEIDFVYNPVTGTRETLWYGLPRNTRTRPTDAAPRIRALDGDVVPLRDWWQQLAVNAGQVPPFEKYTSAGSGTLPLLLAPNGDYWGSGGLPQYATYTCAWGPGDTVRPKMIRVTIILDDTAGRLAEGQTLEYVFELP